MIPRQRQNVVKKALERQAAVALIGPRQIGKTTLALELAASCPSVYLDLESSTDRNKLVDLEFFVETYQDHLIILDEIHRMPEIFQTLRGIIDKGRRLGKRTGRFLMLGSASIDLLRQSGESLAGRITYVNMEPFNVLEVVTDHQILDRLWIRGGYPDSFLAIDDQESFAWRKDFIQTYLQRDVPQFGPRILAETLERLWTMLAHSQGTLLNASRLASALLVSAQTVTRYIDLLVDLLLIRRLIPLHSNTHKRLVKSPKLYIRDSGIMHALLGIADYQALVGNPIVGMSWEGFVVENILTVVPDRTLASFYRTAAGAEMDLVLDLPGGERWAIEIKRGLMTSLSKGFYQACEDIKPARCFIVYGGEECFPLDKKTEVISLKKISELLTALGK